MGGRGVIDGTMDGCAQKEQRTAEVGAGSTTGCHMASNGGRRCCGRGERGGRGVKLGARKKSE